MVRIQRHTGQCPGAVPVRLIIGILLLLLAPSVVRAEDALSAPWLLTPLGRPLDIDVVGGTGTGVVVLLDHDGNALREPVPVDSGRLDLGSLMPEVWRLRRAAYLQLIVDGEPMGSSLVIQPLLSRWIPVTEDALNPNGIRYTRIVGWADETQSPDGDTEEAEGDDLGGDDKPIGSPVAVDHRAWLALPGAEDRLLSGVRVYPERDAVLETTHGALRIALRPDEAPNTSWNFCTLIEGGFYRDIPFHRIVPLTRQGEPFVIQAGDPTTSGSGGPGYWLPMERSGLPHDFGVISMARDRDPDSAGSQIFLCLSRAGTARLDGHYCSFGETIEGAETIDAIAGVPLADVARGRAVEAPRITAARLVPAAPRVPGQGRVTPRVTRSGPEPAPARQPR